MIKRTIEINNPSYLKLKDKQLIIEQEGEQIGKVAIEDLAVLILNHIAIAITHPVMIECQKNNVVIIFCNHQHLPYCCLLPLMDGHSLHHKVLYQQIASKKTTKARIWQSIVEKKIIEQARTLKQFDKKYQRLLRLSKSVKPNDKTNQEAIAAQYYWRELFGQSFKRDYKKSDLNALLNYGYSIVRSAVARSVCAAGLHPTLGLFHKNQYNSLALVDDLIEPFRPWVDGKVYQLAIDGTQSLDQSSKKYLVEILAMPVVYQKNTLPFMVSLGLMMADFKRAMRGEIKKFPYPSKI